MDVPSGFAPFDPQGPFLEHIGPIQVRDGEGGLVIAPLGAVWLRHEAESGRLSGRVRRLTRHSGT